MLCSLLVLALAEFAVSEKTKDHIRRVDSEFCYVLAYSWTADFCGIYLYIYMYLYIFIYICICIYIFIYK
jgi:hypothetical protein